MKRYILNPNSPDRWYLLRLALELLGLAYGGHLLLK